MLHATTYFYPDPCPTTSLSVFILPMLHPAMARPAIRGCPPPQPVLQQAWRSKENTKTLPSLDMAHHQNTSASSQYILAGGDGRSIMLALSDSWLWLQIASSAVQVETISNSVFEEGHDEHSLPVLMKRLKATSIKRSRGTFNKMSIINKMRTLGLAASKKHRDSVKLGSMTPERDPALVTTAGALDGDDLLCQFRLCQSCMLLGGEMRIRQCIACNCQIDMRVCICQRT